MVRLFCCPNNFTRVIASLGQLLCLVARSRNSFSYVYQGDYSVLLGSEPISFHVETEYPWDGKMSIGVDCNAPTPMILRLRIPGWCHNYQITLNDETIDYQLDKGYLIFCVIGWRGGIEFH